MWLVVRPAHSVVNEVRIVARLLTSESHCDATSPMMRHSADGTLIPSKVNDAFRAGSDSSYSHDELCNAH